MNDIKKPYWITIYTLIFILVYMVCFQNYWRFWNSDKGETPFQWDADQYYSYLPATVIYHDLDFTYTNRYWLIKAPNGKSVSKVTYGMALMYSPFFLLGHKIAINQNSPQDGYSEPYSTCVHYGSLFYCLMGLIILALVLRRFYSDKITALTIGTLFFVTNLFFYTLRDGEMTHAYSFFLISLFLWLTCRWHERQRGIYFLWLGLVMGLLTLIRPTEVLLFLVFIGYGVKSITELLNKVKQVIFSYKNLPLFLIGFFAMWLPQIIYWKIKTDHFLFFSYGSSEQFFWTDPQVINLLFSYRKGWFVYTPVMLFSIIGLFILKHKNSALKLPILIYITASIYMLSCWWCWWYGGGFGMRALIQSYALLAIPLAAFYEYVFTVQFKKQIFVFFVRGLTVVLVSGFLCLNIIQTYQYDHPAEQRLLHYDSMSKEAYWRIFGKFRLPESDYVLLQKEIIPANYEGAKKGDRNN